MFSVCFALRDFLIEARIVVICAFWEIISNKHFHRIRDISASSPRCASQGCCSLQRPQDSGRQHRVPSAYFERTPSPTDNRCASQKRCPLKRAQLYKVDIFPSPRGRGEKDDTSLCSARDVSTSSPRCASQGCCPLQRPQYSGRRA